MNPISIWLVTGIFAFVNCDIAEELRNKFIRLPEDKLYDTFRADVGTTFKMNIGNKGKANSVNGEIGRETTKIHELSLEAVDGKQEKEKDFSEGFVYFKQIYDQCKKRANKRIKKLIKTRIKFPVRTYLSELKEYSVTLYGCLKVFGFRYLDEVLGDNFIPVTTYVYFVRDKKNTTDDPVVDNYEQDFSSSMSPFKSRETINDYVMNILDTDWRTLMYDRLQNLLKSHSLKFYLHKSHEGRSRRRDHRMFAMMVMGFMIMASILIPMGFQFLTVLGGKSLLMAKMALIMSAINGLKKIATSNVGYGFYHTGNEGHHHDHIHHGFHEKIFHGNSQNTPSQYDFN